MIGEIEVINSCMTLKLKTKRLYTIYDDVIIPSRHASNKQRPIFSVGIWGHILLPTGHISSKREKRVMDQVMMT